MTTHISQVETTSNVLAGSRVRDVSKKIHEVDPNAAPFTLFFSKADSKVASNPKFEWQEKGLPEKWLTVNDGSNIAATVTTVTVDTPSGNYVRPGNILSVVRTGEKLLVVTASSATSMVVVRAFDGDQVTGSQINDGDDIKIIGSAHAEGADVGTLHSYQETQPFNYTQIFRRAFGATRTLTNSELYSGNSRSRQGMENARDFKILLEESFIYGEKSLLSTQETSATLGPRRTAGGILEFCTTTQAMGGTMTESELETFAQTAFNATGGSAERFLAASATAVSVIDQLAASRLQVVPKEKTYGVAITRWVTGHGEFNIVKHRLLESNTVVADGFAGHMIAIDPKKIGYRYLADSNIKLLKDRQAPGVDGWTDEYLAEIGWEIRNPTCHAIATGITG